MAKANTASSPKAALHSKGKAKREQILSAATDLLLEDGYAGFSMRGVAERAGVGLSHVQYYFPGAAQIVAALLDRFILQYADAVMEKFRASQGSVRTRLTAALEFLLNDDAYRNACAVFMLEVSSFATRDRQVADAMERYYGVYLASVEAIAAEVNPELSQAQRTLRARQCIALIEGMAATRRYLGADAERAFSAKAAASAFELLLS